MIKRNENEKREEKKLTESFWLILFLATAAATATIAIVATNVKMKKTKWKSRTKITKKTRRNVKKMEKWKNDESKLNERKWFFSPYTLNVVNGRRRRSRK